VPLLPKGGHHSFGATLLGRKRDLIFGTHQSEDACQPTNILAAGKIGDSPIKSDVKLGPQTHLGAES